MTPRRAAAGGDRDSRRGDRLGARRRSAGRHDRHALFQAAALCRLEATAGRCASWCSARSGGRPSDRRAAAPRFSAWPRTSRSLLDLFGAAARAGAAGRWRSSGAERRIVPRMAGPELSPLVGEDEWPALLERAPLDLRVNAARTSRDDVLAQFPGAEPTPLSPWGIRLPPDSASRRSSGLRGGPGRSPGRGQPADRARLRARERRADPRPLRRRGRQGAGARRGGAGRARSSPTDSNRARLSKLAAARRAGRGADRDAPAQSAATSWRSSPIGRDRPTSCWSTRRARAAAPGGAIPKDAGG